MLDYSLDKEFEIYECDNCGQGSTENVKKEDLAQAYEEGAYDPEEKIWHKILRPFFNVIEIAKVGYLNSHKREGNSLLEIGTGKGSFLRSALDSGYDAYGIEPSLRSYKVAKAKLGDRVINCTLENMHLNEVLNKKFDFIMLWHVLEHLPEPESAMRVLKTFLKPGGIIIFGVPNFNSYQSRFGGKNWYHLDPPRHLSHFTPGSTALFLKKNEMEIETIKYDSFFQNFVGDIITLNNLFLPHKNVLLNWLRSNRFYFSKTNSFTRLLNLAGFLIFTTILFVPVVLFTLLSQQTKRSGTIVVLARNIAL
jgi:2-polyprenyl-3-methyl-5-hydroxy-6-metoxy-1,4-benzoquinol methylase